MKQFFDLSITVLLLLVTTLLTACSGGASAASAQTEAPRGDPAAGQTLFLGTCAACHGPAGHGLPGLGKDLVNSEFVAGQSDAELVDFITLGRGPDDPLNTTGVTMPAKGGKSSLSDEDLYNIVAYLRTIQK